MSGLSAVVLALECKLDSAAMLKVAHYDVLSGGCACLAGKDGVGGDGWLVRLASQSGGGSMAGVVMYHCAHVGGRPRKRGDGQTEQKGCSELHGRTRSRAGGRQTGRGGASGLGEVQLLWYGHGVLYAAI